MKQLESEFLALSRNQTIQTIFFALLSAIGSMLYAWYNAHSFPTTEAQWHDILKNVEVVSATVLSGFLVRNGDGKITIQSVIDLFKKVEADQEQLTIKPTNHND